MKKIFILILTILFVLPSFGQGNALLWEISKKRAHTTYSYGTIRSQNSRVLSIAPISIK